MRALGWVAALLLLCAAPLQSQQVIIVTTVDTVYQQYYTPLPNNALATTGCLGGKPYPAIDLRIFESDSAAEVVAHEKMHIRQIARAGKGNCPDYSKPEYLLKDEVEAYCATRKYRIARGWSRDSVNANYVQRLKIQFKGDLADSTIERAYTRGCPK